MDEPAWQIFEGTGPLIATSIHSGHEIREDVQSLLAIGSNERLREQDPFTDRWTTVAGHRVTVRRSRFEIDLNRPREEAVYLSPDDAWGLDIWKSEPPQSLIERSFDVYDAFYHELRGLLSRLVEQHQRVVVFDLHSYNHRRQGPDAPPADEELNPEVNVGTATMYRRRWVTVVDRFLAELHDFDFAGRKLDVRENVNFFGGQFPKWIHETFPGSVCVLSIEVKKIFMDEWTGEPDNELIELFRQALEGTVAGVVEELERL